jgi:NADPH:quinone reductase-like Zn-dependent oxidoreductase
MAPTLHVFGYRDDALATIRWPWPNRPGTAVGEFDGLIALVTGAASGIGLATLQELQRGGAKVIAVDRQPIPDESLALGLLADLTDEASVSVAVTSGIASFGGLDILVNKRWHRSRRRDRGQL